MPTYLLTADLYAVKWPHTPQYELYFDFLYTTVQWQ